VLFQCQKRYNELCASRRQLENPGFVDVNGRNASASADNGKELQSGSSRTKRIYVALSALLICQCYSSTAQLIEICRTHDEQCTSSYKLNFVKL